METRKGTHNKFPPSILKPVPFTKSQVHSPYHEEAFLSLAPLPTLERFLCSLDRSLYRTR